MARVLILHASVGAGHKRAAEALGRRLRASAGSRRSRWPTRSTTPRRSIAASIRDGYLELSEKAPALWAYAYERSDHDPSRRARQLRLLVNRLGVTGLDRLIAEFVPDAIVCTHFLPLNLLARERRKGDLPIPLYGVVTDYTGHAFWVYPGVDGYFVATPETAAMLARRGAPAATIAVTGIPIDPAIAAPKDAAAIRAARGLDRAPVVTLMGGGVSVDSVRTIVDRPAGARPDGNAGRRRWPEQGVAGGAGRFERERAIDAARARLRRLRRRPRRRQRPRHHQGRRPDRQRSAGARDADGPGRADPRPGGVERRLRRRRRRRHPTPAGRDGGRRPCTHLLETPGWLPLLRAGAARAGRPRAALAVADAVLAAIKASAATVGARSV